MDPISRVDGLILILQQRLAERAKLREGRRSEPKRSDGQTAQANVNAVRAVALVEGADDHQLGRALVQSMLVDHFGSALVNDANFQQIIDRVTQALEQDVDTSPTWTRTLAELRGAARGPG